MCQSDKLQKLYEELYQAAKALEKEWEGFQEDSMFFSPDVEHLEEAVAVAVFKIDLEKQRLSSNAD